MTMTGREVEALVQQQIAGRYDSSNAHGVDLRRCLVPPRLVRMGTMASPDSARPATIDAWVVLEECPGTTDGYLIVFDPLSGHFGLALYEDRPGNEMCCIGLYGDFMETLAAM